MKLDKFTWGPVVETHKIGPYSIIEYHPQIFVDGIGSKKYDYEKTCFHPFVGGRDCGRGFDTLPSALIGVVAYQYEGPNSQLARYVRKALDNYESPFITDEGELMRNC